jgi:hypothetical protein
MKSACENLRMLMQPPVVCNVVLSQIVKIVPPLVIHIVYYLYNTTPAQYYFVYTSPASTLPLPTDPPRSQ